MTIFLETVANCENFDHLAAIKQQWPLTQQNLNHLPLTNSLTCQGCRCSSCISRQSLVLTLNFLSSMTRNAFSPLHSLSILCFTPNPSSMLLYEDWLGCILQGKRFFLSELKPYFGGSLVEQAFVRIPRNVEMW